MTSLEDPIEKFLPVRKRVEKEEVEVRQHEDRHDPEQPRRGGVGRSPPVHIRKVHHRRNLSSMRDDESQYILRSTNDDVSEVYEPSHRELVIYSVFAGRHKTLQLQMPYIQKLIDDSVVDEVHLWDYTCKSNSSTDKEWLHNTTWHLSPRVFLIVPPKCDWLLYYNFYADHLNDSDFLLKVDDDIIFIDTSRVVQFLRVSRHFPDVFLWSANVINNGKIAALHTLDGLPTNVSMQDELGRAHFFFPPSTGRVFLHGHVGLRLHQLFLAEPNAYRNPKKTKNPIRKIEGRLSINFIGMLGRHAADAARYVREASKWGDEHGITYLAFTQYQQSLMVYMPLTVAHASFSSQKIMDEAIALYQNKKVLNEDHDEEESTWKFDLAELKLPTEGNV